MNSHQQNRRRTFGWRRTTIDPVQHNRRVALRKGFRRMTRQLKSLNRAFKQMDAAARYFAENLNKRVNNFER